MPYANDTGPRNENLDIFRDYYSSYYTNIWGPQTFLFYIFRKFEII